MGKFENYEISPSPSDKQDLTFSFVEEAYPISELPSKSLKKDTQTEFALQDDILSRAYQESKIPPGYINTLGNSFSGWVGPGSLAFASIYPDLNLNNSLNFKTTGFSARELAFKALVPGALLIGAYVGAGKAYETARLAREFDNFPVLDTLKEKITEKALLEQNSFSAENIISTLGSVGLYTLLGHGAALNFMSSGNYSSLARARLGLSGILLGAAAGIQESRVSRLYDLESKKVKLMKQEIQDAKDLDSILKK